MHNFPCCDLRRRSGACAVMIDLLGCRIGEQGVCLYRYGSGTEDQPDKQIDTLPERPEFPPPSLNLVPAFAADLPAKQGGDMLMVCAFLHSFGSLLGLSPVTMDDLLAAGIDAAHHLVCLSLCVCLSVSLLSVYACCCCCSISEWYLQTWHFETSTGLVYGCWGIRPLLCTYQ